MEGKLATENFQIISAEHGPAISTTGFISEYKDTWKSYENDSKVATLHIKTRYADQLCIINVKTDARKIEIRSEAGLVDVPLTPSSGLHSIKYNLLKAKKKVTGTTIDLSFTKNQKESIIVTNISFQKFQKAISNIYTPLSNLGQADRGAFENNNMIKLANADTYHDRYHVVADTKKASTKNTSIELPKIEKQVDNKSNEIEFSNSPFTGMMKEVSFFVNVKSAIIKKNVVEIIKGMSGEMHIECKSDTAYYIINKNDHTSDTLKLILNKIQNKKWVTKLVLFEWIDYINRELEYISPDTYIIT